MNAWGFAGTSLFRIRENIGEVCRDTGSCSFQIRRRYDSSPLAGFGAGYAVGRRTRVEVALSVSPWHRLATRATADFFFVPIEFVRDVVAFHFDVTGRYDLSTGDTRPFVTAGIGRIHYITVDDLPFQESAWDSALVLGGGIDFRLGSRLRGRVEILDHVVPDHLASESIKRA